MNSINRIFDAIVWRVIKNRGGYTDKEIGIVKKTKWVEKLGEMKLASYWIKVEMVKTNRCSVGWKEGDCLYFDFTGMLIKRKCPWLICSHAIAALSPIMYQCLDRSVRGSNPGNMLIDHVTCTDPGFGDKGLGNNLMRITHERMPFLDWSLYMVRLLPHILFYSSRARGTTPGGVSDD